MKSIPDVTLLAIDTDHPRAGLCAMRKSMAQIHFKRAILFTSASEADFGIEELVVDPTCRDIVDSQIVEVKTIAPFKDTTDYSKFIFSGFIPAAVDTSHVLVVHWDGFVLDGSRWDDSFLNFDYIGAPWTKHLNNRVGNGGFSLRSKRLMEFVAKNRPAQVHGEDEVICRSELRLRLEAVGMKFAPEDVAWRFAHEWNGDGRRDPLGFHGAFNFRRFLSMEKIAEIIKLLPVPMLENEHIKPLVDYCLPVLSPFEYMGGTTD